jgi:2-keto-4-pentenoate hydratase/2-oxohepta-3-ene-1,7-dioic acid hydratase in catechol pathway
MRERSCRSRVGRAGARLDSPIWLKPGDRVEVEVAGLGVLSNGVRDEDEAALL